MEKEPQLEQSPSIQSLESKRRDIQRLANEFRNKLFITKGIDKESEDNNRLVMEAIQSAGERLHEFPNDIFAIQMGGSRIKGYNTLKSDIDIALVTPQSGNERRVYEIIQEELDKKGVENHLDNAISLWASFPIKTDPQEFLYTVDHNPEELVSLFGCTVYENPNLALTKLAALEIVNAYKNTGYDWDGASKNFADTYLGERGHIVSKVASRYKMSRSEVEKVLTPALFRERHNKFGIEDPKTMHQTLKRWYSANKRHLNAYVMRNVYEEVKEMLRAGL